MIEISSWLDKFLVALDKAFGERIWFVGLQGSYARNEATNSSDIDVVVILDELTSCDIEKYGNMLHEKSEEILKGLYKSASFVVQAICFKQTGTYIRHQKDLRQIVAPEEQVIVDTFLCLKSGGTIHFQEMSETLFIWAQNWIEKVK